MPTRYSPTVVTLGANWALVGAATGVAAVGERVGPRANHVVDQDYARHSTLSSAVVPDDYVTCSVWDGLAAEIATDYGDTTRKPTPRLIISSVSAVFRLARLVAGNASNSLLYEYAKSSGVVSGGISPGVTSAAFTDYVVPIPGPWTIEDLVSLQVSVFADNGFAAVSTFALSRFHLLVQEARHPGHQRVPLGPNMSEPALICGTCGLPKHYSELSRPANSLHPQYNVFTCDSCYDDSITVDDDNRRGTRRTEGDIYWDI